MPILWVKFLLKSIPVQDNQQVYYTPPQSIPSNIEKKRPNIVDGKGEMGCRSVSRRRLGAVVNSDGTESQLTVPCVDQSGLPEQVGEPVGFQEIIY